MIRAQEESAAEERQRRADREKRSFIQDWAGSRYEDPDPNPDPVRTVDFLPTGSGFGIFFIGSGSYL